MKVMGVEKKDALDYINRCRSTFYPPYLCTRTKTPSKCLGHRTNLVIPEFAPSAGFSTSECELEELCAKFRILEARRADYAKLMRDLKEFVLLNPNLSSQSTSQTYKTPGRADWCK
ncbi:hypothetical protein BYT27DRAFT_7262915 [Phlegmacium glaucopus]|nr:hypothetical protein BYT27DRAFT_7262915 [Phlegmacium glaucopus]